MLTRGVYAAALLTVLAALAGCGGTTSSAEGRAVMTVVWPARTRLIPAAANSITAVLKRDTVVVASQTVARPVSGDSTTTTFEHMKVGALTLEVTAYPNADGTGTAQARGSSPVTVTAGQTSTVTMTMASTVHHLEMSPAAPSVAMGATLQLGVTAKDSAGAVVLLWPAKLQWTTGPGGYAGVNVNGLVTPVKPTGLTPGSVAVSVTDTESGKAVSVPLTVTSNASVTVAPNPFALSVGDKKTFTATVLNASQTDVVWSVQEGSAGGSINGAGLYSAPASAGTFHLIATSAWDNSKTGSATVEVQSGGAIVVID